MALKSSRQLRICPATVLSYDGIDKTFTRVFKVVTSEANFGWSVTPTSSLHQKWENFRKFSYTQWEPWTRSLTITAYEVLFILKRIIIRSNKLEISGTETNCRIYLLFEYCFSLNKCINLYRDLLHAYSFKKHGMAFCYCRCRKAGMKI